MAVKDKMMKRKRGEIGSEKDIKKGKKKVRISSSLEVVRVEQEAKEVQIEDKSIVSTRQHSSGTSSFRIIAGSYEHHLQCQAVTLYKESTAAFVTIFHFTPHTGPIQCLATAKRYLASGGNDEHIRLYDLQKRKELGTLLHHQGSISTLNFSHSGKWLLSTAQDGYVVIWRVKDWQVITQLKGGHDGRINDLSIHPTDRIALTVGHDCTLRLWNLMAGKRAGIIKLSSKHLNLPKTEPLRVSWIDNNHYAIGWDRCICIFDANSNNQDILHKIDLKSSSLQQMKKVNLIIDNDKIPLLIISLGDGSINVYSLKSQKDVQLLFKLSAHSSRVKDFSTLIDDDNNNTLYLSAVSSDGEITLWNLSNLYTTAISAQAQAPPPPVFTSPITSHNPSGERLTCCIMVPESVEKTQTMKKRWSPQDDIANDSDIFSESDASAILD